MNFFDSLAVPDLRIAGGVRGESLPPGYYRFYRDKVSTRGLEVSFGQGQLQVRILTGACREDYKLALKIVKEAAEDAGALVESQSGATIPPAAIEVEHGDRWLDEMEAGAASAIALARKGEVVSLSGPNREFYLGPRTLQELGAASSDELTQKLYARMRQLQYPDEDRYYSANAMVATLSSGVEVWFTALTVNVGYLLPEVDYLALADADGTDPDEMMFLPRDVLLELSTVRCQHLDDVHLLVEPIDAERWVGFVREAAPHFLSSADLERLIGKQARPRRDSMWARLRNLFSPDPEDPE